METNGLVKPTAGQVTLPAERPQKEATATDLPPAQAVGAAAPTTETETAKTQSRSEAAERLNSDYRRSIEIDPETRDVLYKVTDNDTGEVRWQLPAESMLQMRAYNQEVAKSGSMAEAAEDNARPAASMDAAQLTAKVSREI